MSKKEKQEIWMTNNIYNRSVKQKHISIFHSIGYHKGHCENGETSKTKRYFNNGKLMICLYEKDLVPKDFVAGRLPQKEETKQKIKKANTGKTPWNKGTNFTVKPSTREKINKKLQSAETKQKKHDSMLNKNKGKHLSAEAKQKMSKAHKGKKRTQESINKTFETKKRKGICNSSQPEERFYKYLKTIYKKENIERQYKEERYPFYCDFYIKSLDLFIELNFSWTHGGCPFNNQDTECLEQLNIWRQKAKDSDYYRRAIYIWTESDIKKCLVAKQNNLNYRVYYSEKELYNDIRTWS